LKRDDGEGQVADEPAKKRSGVNASEQLPTVRGRDEGQVLVCSGVPKHQIMALISRHPLSAIATRSLRRRGPNIFLNQSILRSGNFISTGRLFSSYGRTVQITYIDQGGKEHSVNAEIGKSLMDTAHDNNIELEGKCSIQRMFS
jgi:hypothetical protein